MDSLTHGLFGLTVAALRRPDVAPGQGPASPTDRAVLLAGVAGALLPDLDYLWPAGDAVLRTLRAHRGLSHSLVASPVVALAAAAVAMAWVRWRSGTRPRFGPVFAFAWLAVVAGHLLPDLWTGWGTRLFLPFARDRLALDWTMVLDPLVTLPLLAGAIWAWRRRAVWRRALLVGLGVACLYVGARVASHAVLVAEVRAAYPSASRVDVFPALLRPTTWRYVAVLDGEYAAGEVGLGAAPRERTRWPRPVLAALPAEARAAAPVAEALAWARFPVVESEPLPDGTRVRVGDLRYHLGGRPTLTFVFELDGQGRLRKARLDRGGSARELLQRWRDDG